MKIKINSKVIAIIITVVIFLVIFFAGPANAIILSLDIPKKDVVRGTAINIMPTIKVESNEIVDIDSIVLSLIKNGDSIKCEFYPNGTLIYGCEGILITLLNSSNSQLGYGYGYTYRNDPGYGYGYGFLPGELKYNIRITTDKLSLGKYKTEFTIKIGNREFNTNGEDITILKVPKLNNRCSIRAFDGTFNVDEKEFSNNRIKFYMTTRDSVTGKGSLSGQKGRDRFNYRFNMEKVIQNNATNLIVKVSGIYRIGRNGELKNLPENATLNFDRIKNKVTVDGDKVKIKSMLINFIEGCDYI